MADHLPFPGHDPGGRRGRCRYRAAFGLGGRGHAGETVAGEEMVLQASDDFRPHQGTLAQVIDQSPAGRVVVKGPAFMDRVVHGGDDARMGIQRLGGERRAAARRAAHQHQAIEDLLRRQHVSAAAESLRLSGYPG
jgi:hypothetical protein